MPQFTIATGVALIILGVGSYLIAGQTSVTALIPAFFGLPLALAGLVATRDALRKHAMHVAALIALLGAGGALSRAIPTLTAGKDIGLSTVSQLIMGVGLILFLIICIRSFIAARRGAA
ncbi:MAG: hypothetical protein AAF610_15390 [Pseudomonadota bacterium]